MADIDGISLFGEALLWIKFNGIIERFSRAYITMGQYLHIQCKTIELSTHWIVCVDLEKAFDRVDRELLWQVLERYGVRGRLKEAVEPLYLQSEACVRVQGKNSEWFEVVMGVRQGCTMSPWLFNLVMDSIVREATKSFQGGVQLEGSKVQFLLFADDLVLVAENEEDIKKNAEVLNEVMKKWKMRINWQKTKVMVVQRGGGTCHLVVDDVEVEAVQTTKYLGAMFNVEASCDNEIENRIGMATEWWGH